MTFGIRLIGVLRWLFGFNQPNTVTAKGFNLKISSSTLCRTNFHPHSPQQNICRVAANGYCISPQANQPNHITHSFPELQNPSTLQSYSSNSASASSMDAENGKLMDKCGLFVTCVFCFYSSPANFHLYQDQLNQRNMMWSTLGTCRQVDPLPAHSKHTHQLCPVLI